MKVNFHQVYANCMVVLQNKSIMAKYVIKIDKRKKIAIREFEERYKCSNITKCIAEDRLFVNESEDDYTSIKSAKLYNSKAEAEDSITEDFELVFKIS